MLEQAADIFLFLCWYFLLNIPTSWDLHVLKCWELISWQLWQDSTITHQFGLRNCQFLKKLEIMQSECRDWLRFWLKKSKLRLNFFPRTPALGQEYSIDLLVLQASWVCRVNTFLLLTRKIDMLHLYKYYTIHYHNILVNYENYKYGSRKTRCLKLFIDKWYMNTCNFF